MIFVGLYIGIVYGQHIIILNNNCLKKGNVSNISSYEET